MPIPAGGGAPPTSPTGPLVYDPTLSRVRLTADGLFDAVPVTVQRSIDRIRWSTVRGGVIYPQGGAIRLDDYEFTPDATNWYRVSVPAITDPFDTPASNGWGPAWATTGGASSDYAVTSDAATQTLTSTNVLRNGLRTVDHTSGAVSVEATVPVVPTGAPITVWLPWRATGAGTYYAAQLTIEAGGLTRLAIVKRVSTVLTILTLQVPVGTHRPVLPWRMLFEVTGPALRARAWQGTTEPGWQVSVNDSEITSGVQAGLLSRRETGNTNGTTTVSFDNFAVVNPSVAAYEGSIIPVLDSVWLKSLAKPFLNRRVLVSDVSELTRTARTGIHPIVGRSSPVAVSDVRAGRQWTMTVATETDADRRTLDLLMASGDTLLVQVPAGSRVPSGYVQVGDTSQRLFALDPASDTSLPLTEVAAPGPDVVGATVTWQSVLNRYATWGEMLAAHPTWASVLELVGDPEDVIVP